jgi:hypothetical protein
VAAEAFDRNFLVPAHANELRQAVRIIGIDFVDLHRQCRLGVPRIDAHHWRIEFPEAVPVPRAQLPGLEPDAHRVRRLARMAAAMTPGVDTTVPRHTTAPAASMTQMDVNSSDTSNKLPLLSVKLAR